MMNFLLVLIGLLIPWQLVLAQSLMSVAKRGDLAQVKKQIEAGISPNQLEPDDWRETPPLFAAIKNEHTKVASYLIAQGADCKTVDFAGKNAFVYAAQSGVTEIIGQLVDCGADLEVIGGDGTNRTPLVWAVISKHELTAIELMKNGAKTDIVWVHPTKDTSHKLVDTIADKGLVDLLAHLR